ncbi:hypothetical protein ymoll0001_9650 [Yersinia mollaretii ATCC 43969]|uniref:Uncharacterized protein n=1 Tax=Yersinia mollaretii (strain ATCC 43969 / DSM 18520 / CIP 103324 / CNY 7263 / WAIP 204) TaxID=349967 RepID=A0ABP2E9C0_YERMW|nr:hypothetical protein ymoll0001_9650 [Yersinia mollaretii ATCC 43969]
MGCEETSLYFWSLYLWDIKILICEKTLFYYVITLSKKRMYRFLLDFKNELIVKTTSL